MAELKTAERTRLAAEIHDSISQILTGAAMQLDAGETAAAKRILASCRRELRACLWDLRSRALDEKDILKLVAKGFNNDEIAKLVGITRHGVKAHLAIAFERLGAASRTEAASIALSHGLI